MKLKRIDVIVRNIGLEGTDQAFGMLSIEFADEKYFNTAIQTISLGLKNPLHQSVILENETGKMIGFNPHHYAYHYVDDAEEQQDSGLPKLPPDGAPPPEREKL